MVYTITLTLSLNLDPNGRIINCLSICLSVSPDCLSVSLVLGGGHDLYHYAYIKPKSRSEHDLYHYIYIESKSWS